MKKGNIAAPAPRNLAAKHAPRKGGVHGGGYTAKHPSRAGEKARARREAASER